MPLLLCVSLSSCTKTVYVEKPVPTDQCITDPPPKFPGLPGAHDCLDNEVCLPEPDWKALLEYLWAIQTWSSTNYELCKGE